VWTIILPSALQFNIARRINTCYTVMKSTPFIGVQCMHISSCRIFPLLYSFRGDGVCGGAMKYSCRGIIIGVSRQWLQLLIDVQSFKSDTCRNGSCIYAVFVWLPL